MDDLRALAEAATPGPWSWWNDLGRLWERDGDERDRPARLSSDEEGGILDFTYPPLLLPDDAAYLAAIDPTTLLALLDERDVLLAIKAAAVALVAHDSVDNFNALCDAVGVGDEPAEPGQ